MNPQLCAICGGSLEPRTITHRQSWGDELVEFEDVPAMVCRQCGESWLGPEAIDLIEAGYLPFSKFGKELHRQSSERRSNALKPKILGKSRERGQLHS